MTVLTPEQREHRRKTHRDWCVKNRDRRRASNRKYFRTNRDKVLKSNQRYAESHREEIRSRAINYNITHRDERRAYSKTYHPIYYANNRKRILDQTRDYAKAHPEVRKKILSKRRGANVNCRTVGRIIKQWKSEPDFICFYCSKVYPISELEIEHVKALSKGGEHSVSNVAKSCKGCNKRKAAMGITEFVSNGQRFLL